MLMQGKKVNIEISNPDDIKIIYENNSEKKIKHVTADTLYDIILGSMTKVNNGSVNYSSTGILPHTNVRLIEFKEDKTKSSKIYVMKKENIKTKITYYDTVFNNIKIPDILFGVKVVNNKITSSWVCCVKSKNINQDTMLYRFPFSNVFDSTSICWGSNKIYLIKVDEIRNLFKMPGLFLSIPFNDHNYAQANNSKMEFRKLLEYLENNDFDNSWLKPIGSYSDWFNKIN